MAMSPSMFAEPWLFPAFKDNKKFSIAPAVRQLKQGLPGYKIPRIFYAWPAGLPPFLKLQRQTFHSLLAVWLCL